MKKRLRILVVVCALVLLFGMAYSSAEAEPKSGGTLKMVVGGTYNNAGYPVGAAGQGKWLSLPAVESLGRYGEDGQPEGWLAREIISDPENLQITLKLQEGVRFHDGTTFNASAVCEVWKLYLENGNCTNFFTSVDSYEPIDEYTVVIKLNTWSTSIVSNLCIECGYMISPTEYRKVGLENINTDICGTGPFKMKSYDVTSGITFVRNDDYWQDDKPYLDGIEMIFCNDNTTAENIFKSGEANMLYGLTAEQAYRLEKEGVELVYNPSCLSPTHTGVFFASGNQDDPISDLRVRKAFCHAIDKQALVDAFTYGLGTISSQIAVPGTKEYNADVIGYEYNPAKAKEMLKDAGYDEGECTITFYYQPNEEDMYVAIKGMLEKAGFAVVGDTRTGTENRIIYGTSDPYTCCTIFYAPTTIENWYRYFSAKPFTYAVNTIDMAAAGIVETYEKCVTALTAEEQHEAMMSLQVLVTDNCLYCPLYSTPVMIMATDGTVHDHELGEIWHLEWRPENTWMD